MVGKFEHAGLGAPMPFNGSCGLSRMILECDRSSADAMTCWTSSFDRISRAYGLCDGGKRRARKGHLYSSDENELVRCQGIGFGDSFMTKSKRSFWKAAHPDHSGVALLLSEEIEVLRERRRTHEFQRSNFFGWSSKADDEEGKRIVERGRELYTLN